MHDKNGMSERSKLGKICQSSYLFRFIFHTLKFIGKTFKFVVAQSLSYSNAPSRQYDGHLFYAEKKSQRKKYGLDNTHAACAQIKSLYKFVTSEQSELGKKKPFY